MTSNKAFKRRWGLLILAVLASSTVQAKTILISDIDDTLKMSHVNSSVDRLEEAMKVSNPFYLMPELLQAISAEKIFYVSNAPQSIMGNAHRRFLAHNKFPAGEVHLRPSVWSPKDKKPVLRKIIDAEAPSKVILFGDNAEQDPEFYQDIEKEYPGIQFVTFIRWAYDPEVASKFGENQIPFVAAGEVALQLNQMNLFKDELVLNLVHLGAIDLKLPAWLNCKYHLPRLPTKEVWKPWTDKLYIAIYQRCNLQ